MCWAFDNTWLPSTQDSGVLYYIIIIHLIYLHLKKKKRT